MWQELLKTKNIVWLILALVLCFATLNRHSRSKIYTYSSTLMSDKAGYYVYLPAFFLYNFEANKFPEKIDSLTGNGFSLLLKSNKVQTKYPVGTALLQTPFFVAAHLYVLITKEEANGFSKPYQNAIDLSAVFYFLLGLYFLRRFLSNYFPSKTILWALFFTVFGSNLYYYSVFEGAYSHVYSFFLFSLFLFLLHGFSKEQKSWQWIGLFAVSALILLVRQLNIVFIFTSLFLIEKPLALLNNRSLKDYFYAISAALLLLIPQIAYNIYLTKSIFFYSYQNEGFIYWNNPKLIEVLLGFENGLLSTNPILFLSILGFIALYKKQKSLGIISILAFVICSYLYASWWCYHLGCAYGHRGFIDIFPLLIISMCASVFWIQQKNNKALSMVFYTVCSLGVLLNIKYIYTYDSCWPKTLAQSDFEIYWHFVTSQIK